MDRPTIELKIAPKYFAEVYVGRKTFELRKNDRDFQVGDFVRLREWKDGDNVEEIIEKYVKTPRQWYERSYSHPIYMKEFRDSFGKKHEGNLLVFATKRIYLD